MKSTIPIFALFAILILSVACNKSSPFGAELLDDQKADLNYTELDVTATLLEEDSVLTADPTSVADYFLCGRYNEPVFGQSEAVIYSSMRLTQYGFDFGDAPTIEKVELRLGFDNLAFYGDTTKMHTLEVYQLAEPVLRNETYYSNQTLPLGNLLGTFDFVPKPSNAAPIIDTSNASVSRDSAYGNYISIPLEKSFAEAIVGLDSNTISNDTLFNEFIKGIAIRSVTDGAIMGIDLNNSTFSHIMMWYKSDASDTSVGAYKIRFSGTNKFVHFAHNRPSDLNSKIGVANSEKLYLQGMGGLRTKIEFRGLDTLKNAIINKAELTLTVDENPINTDETIVPNQLIVTYPQGDSVALISPDISYSQSVTSGSFSLFGGQPKTENGKTVYRLNLTEHLQDILLGRREDSIFINVFPQVRAAERSVFFGPSDTDNPIKLVLKYTNL